MSSRSTVDNRGRKIVNKKKTKKGRSAAQEADPQLALGLQEMEVEGGAKDDLQISADTSAALTWSALKDPTWGSAGE